MSYLKDREVWLEKTPTGNPPIEYYWKFIQDGVVVVRDSDGVDRKMAIDSEKAPIQDNDIWLLTTTFTGTQNPITTNLARASMDGVGIYGDGMTEASGVFSFPKTGVWEIEFALNVNITSGATRIVTPRIEISRNNGVSFNVRAGVNSFVHAVTSANYRNHIRSKFPFNVTDIANDKVRFGVEMTGDDASVVITTTDLRTYFNFKRIADSV